MKRFSLLVLFFISTVMTLHAATTYCAETITSTNGQHTAKITCSSLGDNRYQFVFVSTDAFTSYNTGSNFYMNVNGAGGYQVSAHLTQDGNTLTAVIESTTTPTIYAGDFFVYYSDGGTQSEAHFIILDADFSQTCAATDPGTGGGTSDPDPDPCAAGGGVDWAAGRSTCVAAHTEGENKAVNAVDGNIETRWSGWGAGDNNPDWWQVDFGQARMLDSVRIMFENNQIDGYAVKGSTDGTHWYSLVEVNAEPQVFNPKGYVKHLLPENSMARYLQVEPIGVRRNMSFWEFNAFGDCVKDDRPVMLSAVVDEESISETSAKVRVEAADCETPFANIRYNVVITRGTIVGNKETMTADNGVLSFSGLENSATYTLQIWALDADGNESENKKVVSITTAGQYTGLYLINNNQPSDFSMRFRKTEVSGVYVVTADLPAGTFTYHLYDKDKNTVTNTDGSQRPLVLNAPTTVTFYAKDVNTFASNADSIFLSGPLVGTDYSVAEAKLCTWVGDLAVWTGSVDKTKEYTISKIMHPDNGNTDKYDNDIMQGTEKADGVTTDMATFTFDLPTLSWNWKNYFEGQCEYHGTKGEGTDLVASVPFEKGYDLTLRLSDDRTKLIVKAVVLDDKVTPGNCYFQNYPNLNPYEGITEYSIPKVDGTTNEYLGEITITNFSNWQDGMIRFGIKFEVDGVRITMPEYFYIDGTGGCAERQLIIYHHTSDLADVEADNGVMQYAGGKVLQPIKYKRKFKPGVWETLCVPFEVDSITVTDSEGTYRLHAQYDHDNDANTTSVSGHFWLREFRTTPVCAEDFQENWYDIQAANEQAAMPKKNKPYIMRVPEGDYYADKYITFHGAGYQTIDQNYAAPALPAEGLFSYSGNNTMRPWHLLSAYVLDAPGEFFYSKQPVTLQPFECAVNATQTTINRMPRLQMASRQIATDHSLPSTADEQGRIYTLMGTLVGQYSSVDAKDAALQRLPEGLYILQTDRETSKIYIAK